jgi:hypothetical protein
VNNETPLIDNHRQAYLAAKGHGFNWVAMDSDGTWFGYMVRPIPCLEVSMWQHQGGDDPTKLAKMDPVEEHWPSTLMEVRRHG